MTLSTPQLKAIARTPERYHKIYAKALHGNSFKASVTAKCLECCAWIRKESGIDKIKDCPSIACPLWPKRPFQPKNPVENTTIPNPNPSDRMAAARAAKKPRNAKLTQTNAQA